MTEVEAEWDDRERAWALALIDVEADTCNGCGHPLSETLHPDAYQGYRASDASVCQGCKEMRRKQSEYAKAEDPDVGLLRFGVKRVWTSPDPGPSHNGPGRG